MMINRILLCLLLLCAAAMGGCPAVGWMAHAVSEVAPAKTVEAEYTGLANHKVAVLVDADLGILFQHPLAQLEVTERVSQLLAANVEGITVIEPRQVVDFQQRNIYWNTASYQDIAQRLGVERLVMIELLDYRLHEPGNVNIWRGLISANVRVAETDSAKPNDAVYATTVTAAYPPKGQIGAVNADQRTIRLGVLDLFGRGVGGKFYDQKVEREP